MGYFWEQLLNDATLWDGIRKCVEAMRLQLNCVEAIRRNIVFVTLCRLFTYNQSSRFIIKNFLSYQLFYPTYYT
jgi:hypothetical protein